VIYLYLDRIDRLVKRRLDPPKDEDVPHAPPAVAAE
jgi:hypothetical protein